MSNVKWKKDVRQPGDDRRRGNFKSGYRAALDGQEYGEKTLEELTWQNLGWRFGNIVGEDLDKQKLEELYELLVALQHQTTDDA